MHVILENFDTANEALVCCGGFVAILCRQQSPIAMRACVQFGAKLMDFHQFFLIPSARAMGKSNLAILAKRLK